MNVISGKKPLEYAQCLSEKLADSRGALQVEKQKDGVRVIVPQKLTSGPAAVFDIEQRSGGSSIKLHERISNVPIRPIGCTRCRHGVHFRLIDCRPSAPMPSKRALCRHCHF